MLFTRIPSGHAQTETYKNVDSTLYAYYRWCNNNIRDSVVLLKADTLFRLAGEKNDIRMQAVALSFKADHYYFNNELDSLKAWIPRVQAFARANEQPTYYFFTWSRLILYYTKHGQYTLAQYELERYMAQAEQDDYKPAIAEAYKQLGHIYRTRGLKETAADYYRKAIGFIEENNLNKFSLPILYSELATVLIDTGRYEEAAEELEKGKARLTLPEYIWPLKLKQVILYSRTGRSAEARTLFDQIRQGHDGYLTTASLTEAQLAINLAEHEFGRALTTLDKLIGLFKETGHSETYFSNCSKPVRKPMPKPAITKPPTKVRNTTSTSTGKRSATTTKETSANSPRCSTSAVSTSKRRSCSGRRRKCACTARSWASRR